MAGGSSAEGSRQEGPRREVVRREGPQQEDLLSVKIVCQPVSQRPKTTAPMGGAGQGCWSVAGAVPNLFQSLAL